MNSAKKIESIHLEPKNNTVLVKAIILFFYKDSVFWFKEVWVQDKYSQFFLPKSSWYIFSIFLLYINKAIKINLPKKGS